MGRDEHRDPWPSRRLRPLSLHLPQLDPVDGRGAPGPGDPHVAEPPGARDRLAAGLDYEINLKAEVEIMALHDKLDRIRMERLEGVLDAQSTQIEAIAKAVGIASAKPATD